MVVPCTTTTCRSPLLHVAVALDKAVHDPAVILHILLSDALVSWVTAFPLAVDAILTRNPESIPAPIPLLIVTRSTQSAAPASTVTQCSELPAASSLTVPLLFVLKSPLLS